MVCAFTLFFALRWDNSQLQSPPSFEFPSDDWLVRVKLNDRQLCCAYNHPAVDTLQPFWCLHKQEFASHQCLNRISMCALTSRFHINCDPRIGV